MAAMGAFDDETRPDPVEPGRWRCALSGDWNIGDNANGGYALSPVLRALAIVGTHADPISVTTSFLRPVQGGVDAEITSDLVRAGRTTTVATGTLSQDGRERLRVLATFGSLRDAVGLGPELVIPPPELPPPEQCVDRRDLEQGVDLPILHRLDVRIHPDRARAGESSEAVVEGWIRLTDGSEPTTLTLPLFADAFPPSLFALLGRVGWVPTIELTVHVRRRPAQGWVQARFECDDLQGGRMIETGCLWDSNGELVARSRQLGLLLDRD